MKNLFRLLAIFVVFSIFITTLYSSVNAQIQFFEYSGNSAESYQCFDDQGKIIREGNTLWKQDLVYKDPISGYFLCSDVNFDGIAGDDRAVLIPPTLQQLEIWFVRILYAVWAIVGSLSFLLLVGVGYEYMIRGGTSDQELVKLRKRIINYVIGFALVFLAVPILTTVFNLLGVNDDVACYNVNMPGFQFFFTSLCTGTEEILRNACENGGELASGLACGIEGDVLTCTELLGNDEDGNPLYTGNRTFLCSPGFGGEANTWIDFR